MVRRSFTALISFSFRAVLLLAMGLAFIPVQPVQAVDLTVNVLYDEGDSSCSDGDCSLRDAIYLAASGEEISFSVTGTILLNNPLSFAKNLTISGPANGSIVISGRGTMPVFQIGGGTVVLNNLTIRDGFGPSGAGLFIYNGSNVTLNRCVITNNNNRVTNNYGGGLAVNTSAQVTLNDSIVSGNSSYYGGGAYLYSGATATFNRTSIHSNTAYIGGGLYSYGTVNLNGSTLYNNTALDSFGGLFSQGNAFLLNTTISGNSATYSYGGIYSAGYLNLRSSTIAFNQALNYAGVYSNGNNQIFNSIIAGNYGQNGSNDCSGTLVLYGYTLIQNPTCSMSMATDPGTNLIGVEPRLGTLQDNGGATLTHALLQGSPAIDKIPLASSCNNSATTDQRGQVRPNTASQFSNDLCDIGAFEAQYVSAVSPLPFSRGISAASPVSASLNAPVETLSITKKSLAVHGSYTGRIQGAFSANVNKAVVTPAQPFFPGETVTVSATSGLKDVNGKALANIPAVWQFTMDVSPSAGSFMPHPATPAFNAGDALEVAFGDIDGDRDLDAVTAGPGAETTWLNDGAGNLTFGAFFGGEPSTGVDLGDLDGDGDLDVLITNGEGSNPESVWMNNGTGTFSFHSYFNSVTPGSADTALGDVDGDGDLDAVVVHLGLQSRVYLNNGSGSFTFNGAFGIYEGVTSVALADLDLDGDLDAVTTATSGVARTFLNDGRGTFISHPTQPAITSLGAQLMLVLAGDLTGDGLPDLILASEGPAQSLQNVGGGVFSPITTFGMALTRGGALGDVNGDDTLDLLLANTTGLGSNADTVWLNNGSGTFYAGSSPLIDPGNMGSSLALGDLDGDGDLDTVISNLGSAGSVLINNAAPEASFFSLSGDEDLPVSFTAVNFTSHTSDDDGDPLTAVRIASLPTDGTLSLGAAPITLDQVIPVADLGLISYQPDLNWSGGDYFDWQAFDGSAYSTAAPVELAIYPVNDAPNFTGLSDQTIPEGVLYEFTFSFADVDGDSITLNHGTLPAGMNFDPDSQPYLSWQPSEAQGPGDYPITLTLWDGTVLVTQTITVHVTETNTAPTINTGDQTIPEGQLLTLVVDVTDPDLPANTLTYGAQEPLPDGASFDPLTHALTWTPSEAQGPGDYPVTLTVDDGSGPVTKAITLHVDEADAAPSITTGDQITAEDQLLSFVVQAADTDLPVNALTLALTGGLPSGAAWDEDTWTFTWTPSETQGPDTYPVTFSVSDGTTAVEKVITITVTETNAAPTFGPIGNQNASEGQSFSLDLTGYADDSDLPANTFSYYAGPDAPAGLTVHPTTGILAWTPGETTGGSTVTFTVGVSDGTDQTDISLTIDVAETNQDPYFTTPGDQTVDSGTLLEFAVMGADDDLPANTLIFALKVGTALPDGATFDSATRTFLWTPTLAQAGQHAVVFTLTDGVSTVERTVTIEVVSSMNYSVFLPMLMR